VLYAKSVNIIVKAFVVYRYSDAVRRKVTREVKVMARLSHPNIVRYFDSCFDDWAPDSCHNDTNQLPVGKSTVSVSIPTPDPSAASSSSSSSSSFVFVTPEPSAATSASSSVDNISSRSTSVDKVVYLYIRMELCRGGTLRDWLDRNREDRNVERCVKIYRSVVEAIHYLHQEKNFMHRDIKVMQM